MEESKKEIKLDKKPGRKKKLVDDVEIVEIKKQEEEEPIT